MKPAKAERIDDVVATLAGLQSLIQLHGRRVQSIDVNPLLVSDSGCVAVDALIVPKLS